MTHLDDPVHSGKKLFGHGSGQDVPVCETEGLHAVLDECRSLSWVASDARVLHEDWPAATTSQLKPLEVGNSLVGRDAVDLSQGPKFDPGSA